MDKNHRVDKIIYYLLLVKQFTNTEWFHLEDFWFD